MKREKARGLVQKDWETNRPVRAQKLGKPVLNAGRESRLGGCTTIARALSSFSAEQILRSVAESPSDCVVMLDNAGRILFSNRSLSSQRVDQILGRPLRELVRPEHGRRLDDCLRHVIDSGRPASFDLEIHDADGAPQLLEARVNPVIRDGEVAAFVLHAAGPGGRKTIERRSLQSLKMESLGKLAVGLTHEYNNLLTVVSIYSDLLAGYVDTSDPVCQESLQQLEKAVDRGTSLGRQLLAFSRKEPAVPVKLGLNKLVTEIESALKRLLGPTIEMRLALSRSLWRVTVDPSQMQQALWALVTNAGDAMPDGGEIVIETRNLHVGADSSGDLHLPSGPYVLLTVTDTGVGMDEPTQASVFEPFFTTKGRGQGTGLGLCGVYGTVRQSGGRVLVESTPGKGTRFKLYLPRT